MAAPKTQTTYVALMRGINLGAKNKLSMKDLAAIFADAGCTDVRTYINSGNLIFRATPSVAKALDVKIPRQILDRFGLRVPVVLRTAEQMEKIVRANPYPHAAALPKTLHVCFLSAESSADAPSKLNARRVPPEEVLVYGREIYMHLPNGVADSKLANSPFDSITAAISTTRNWNTVCKLLELMQA